MICRHPAAKNHKKAQTVWMIIGMLCSNTEAPPLLIWIYLKPNMDKWLRILKLIHLSKRGPRNKCYVNAGIAWCDLHAYNSEKCIDEHYSDVIMGVVASQITSVTIIYSTGYSDTYQRKHQSSASLAFVRGIHRWPVNSSHKGPVTRKMFPFDDVIMRL